jgi:hypothetical protein
LQADERTTTPSTAEDDPNDDDDDNDNTVFIRGTSEFDPNIVNIKSVAIPSTCNANFGSNIPAGSACIQVIMTISSAVPSADDISTDDLDQIGEDIISTVESGLFADALVFVGLDVAVIVPATPRLATDAPTFAPTELVVVSTLAPSVVDNNGDTITVRPTNTNPTDISVPTSSEPITPTITDPPSTVRITTAPASLTTEPPVFVPVPSAPPPVVDARPADASAGSSYLSGSNVLMNTVVSGICMTMLLLYRQ